MKGDTYRSGPLGNGYSRRNTPGTRLGPLSSQFAFVCVIDLRMDLYPEQLLLRLSLTPLITGSDSDGLTR
jgi:hypothetical protein